MTSSRICGLMLAAIAFVGTASRAQTREQFDKVKGLTADFKGLATYLQDKSLAVRIEREYQELLPVIEDGLKSARGVLLEVPMYKHSEGQKVMLHIRFLGAGDDLRAILKRAKNEPSIGEQLPSSLQFDWSAGGLIWVTKAKDGRSQKQSIGAPLYQALVKEALAAPQKRK